MMPIEAITNRISQLNNTVPGFIQNRSPRSSLTAASKAKRHRKVELLVRDPVLWAEFKRRVAARNHFSNAAVPYVMHDFFEEFEIPGLNLADDTVSVQTARGASTARGDEKTPKGENGTGRNNRFRLFQSLRARTLDPPTPDISYSQSPSSHFSNMPCPESPGSQLNLSPTKTPLTPISATTATTVSTMTPASDVTIPKELRTRGNVIDFLEQPNF